MTPQERDVISGIFDRLKQAGDAPRDPETERFIADLIARQPYAPYVMAQSIYVQEQALINMQKQVEQLQAQVQEAQSRPPQQQSGGFLSGLFGGGASQAAAPAPRPAGLPPQSQNYAPQQQAAPWGGQPQQPAPGPWGGQAAAPQSGAGGFLKSAAMTAAGVAGGMVVGNMLMNAFTGSGHAHAAGLGGDGNSSGFGDALNGNASAQKTDDAYQDAQQDAEVDRQQVADDAYQDAQQDQDWSDDSDSDSDDDS